MGREFSEESGLGKKVNLGVWGKNLQKSGFWTKSQSLCMGRGFSEEWVLGKKVKLGVWGKNLLKSGFWTKSQSLCMGREFSDSLAFNVAFLCIV